MIAALQLSWLLFAAPAQRPEDIHDAHPVTGPEILPSREDSSLWFWIAGGAVGIAVLFVLIRRRKGQPVRDPAAQDWARERFARLAARNENAASAEEIAAVIRGYLRRRFGVAESLSTQELGASHQAADEMCEWLRLLDRCDLTKFARIGFGPVEAAETIRRAQTLLTATLPISEGSPPTKTGEFR